MAISMDYDTERVASRETWDRSSRYGETKALIELFSSTLIFVVWIALVIPSSKEASNPDKPHLFRLYASSVGMFNLMSWVWWLMNRYLGQLQSRAMFEKSPSNAMGAEWEYQMVKLGHARRHEFMIDMMVGAQMVSMITLTVFQSAFQK